MPGKEPQKPKPKKPPVKPGAQGIEFEVWWVLNSKNLAPQHRKEIIWADFKARGLKEVEPAEAYDAALKKYGV